MTLLTTCIHSCGICRLKLTSTPMIVLLLSVVNLHLCYYFTLHASAFCIVSLLCAGDIFCAYSFFCAYFLFRAVFFVRGDFLFCVDFFYTFHVLLFPCLCLRDRLILARFLICPYVLRAFPRPNKLLGFDGKGLWCRKSWEDGD